MLRNKLTPELTSPRTIRRFSPEVNQLADDFNNLISLARDGNNVVKGFEAYCNRMGLESMCDGTVQVAIVIQLTNVKIAIFIAAFCPP